MKDITLHSFRYLALTATLCAALVLPLVPPAHAEDRADAALCTLHVWPGSALRSTYLGWFHGGIVDGAVTGRDGYRKLPEQPLDTAQQRKVLEGSDIAATLGLAGYKVVIHPEALDSRTMRTTPGPWLPDGGACHAELAVDDIFFQEDVISGRYLKVIYRYRSFQGAATPTRSFGQIIGEKLVLFPPAKPEDDPRPALDELNAAMGRSIRDFGAALTAPPRKKR